MKGRSAGDDDDEQFSQNIAKMLQNVLSQEGGGASEGRRKAGGGASSSGKRSGGGGKGPSRGGAAAAASAAKKRTDPSDDDFDQSCGDELMDSPPQVRGLGSGKGGVGGRGSSKRAKREVVSLESDDDFELDTDGESSSKAIGRSIKQGLAKAFEQDESYKKKLVEECRASIKKILDKEKDWAQMA
eukprot:CAMPEP_0173461886 /NCGR_PEP_ID=MMETSP1357-20121228/65692_1 /TAXON_ID=77926 /ORGANISM="Hemiselmis rufescens, Strain PCC563" /LENGTH=185 /DNA_ID=CAMNT_0014429581 /DNA_START=91 /DNA_END=644 /DNA_ORIENTATION=-